MNHRPGAKLWRRQSQLMAIGNATMTDIIAAIRRYELPRLLLHTMGLLAAKQGGMIRGTRQAPVWRLDSLTLRFR